MQSFVLLCLLLSSLLSLISLQFFFLRNRSLFTRTKHTKMKRKEKKKQCVLWNNRIFTWTQQPHVTIVSVFQCNEFVFCVMRTCCIGIYVAFVSISMANRQWRKRIECLKDKRNDEVEETTSTNAFLMRP